MDVNIRWGHPWLVLKTQFNQHWCDGRMGYSARLWVEHISQIKDCRCLLVSRATYSRLDRHPKARWDLNPSLWVATFHIDPNTYLFIHPRLLLKTQFNQHWCDGTMGSSARFTAVKWLWLEGHVILISSWTCECNCVGCKYLQESRRHTVPWGRYSKCVANLGKILFLTADFILIVHLSM